MSVQSVGNTMYGINAFNATVFSKAEKGTDSLGVGNAGQNPTPVSQSFSAESLSLQYANSQGDTVTLSAQSRDFQKAVLTANQSSSPDEWKKIIASIKDEYQTLKSQIVDALFNANNGQEKKADSVTVADPRSFDETKEIPGLPEYWSADKTAQRIVDFATSFSTLFQGSKDDFVAMIKDAVEKGFSQAKDIQGDLPDPINKLVAKTHALVTDKIDAWAKSYTGQSTDVTA